MLKNKQHIIWGLSVISIALMGAIVWRATKVKQKIDLKKFDSPDSPGSGRCMDRQFIRMLEKLEKKTKYPVFQNINSGARTGYWNTKVGGVSNSSHKIPTCKAADIHAPTKAVRNKIVVAAKLVGFKRIGVGKTFVHLDNDKSKKQFVAWGYPSGSKPPINPFV